MRPMCRAPSTSPRGHLAGVVGPPARREHPAQPALGGQQDLERRPQEVTSWPASTSRAIPAPTSNPAVHIAMHVARKGDDNNVLSRAKYVIDLLQVYKQTVTGKRVQGLLDLIENDDVLNNANRTVEEYSRRHMTAASWTAMSAPSRSRPTGWPCGSGSRA